MPQAEASDLKFLPSCWKPGYYVAVDAFVACQDGLAMNACAPKSFDVTSYMGIAKDSGIASYEGVTTNRRVFEDLTIFCNPAITIMAEVGFRRDESASFTGLHFAEVPKRTNPIELICSDHHCLVDQQLVLW